ncbi:MAG: hypothetical protein J5685_00395 [Clostridiales bacterium]|nr:hypothetical protein [Clostridiales bacterium]
MSLFKPKWMHKNEEKALAFVTQLQDEDQLLSAVLESPHEKVRMTAARKLRSDDAILRAMKGVRLGGKKNDQIKKELIDQLHDKSRLNEYISDPDLIIRYYSLKYNGHDKEAFENLKKEVNPNNNIAIECFWDSLSVDEMKDLLITSSFSLKKADSLIEHLKNTIDIKEEFENIMYEVATQTKNDGISRLAFWELTIPEVIQKYKDYLDSIELRKQLETEERKRQQEKLEEEKKQKALEENKKRFFRGEELSWSDEKVVINNLTIEEIKSTGLTDSLFEKLCKYTGDRHVIEVLVSEGETPVVSKIVDTYLFKWLNEKDEYKKQNLGEHTHSAAKILVELYRNDIFADRIKQFDGKILQPRGKMPVFDMSDPLQREMSIGYSADPEIRFDLNNDYGLKYNF